MNIFYIDTSSNYLYICIQSNNKIISFSKNYSKDLSKYAMVEIDKLFKKANLTPIDINKIIVVSGPGSFTGIRIGMTFAKIFSWSLKKDITTISSLEAMAASSNINDIVVPIIDARRGYVYSGVYKADKCILKDQYIELTKLKKFLNNLNEKYYYITNDKNFDLENILNYHPDFSKIISKYKDKKTINAHFIEPNYLKLTEAEEKLGSVYDN